MTTQNPRIDPGLDFEHWISCILPEQLYLPKPKKGAMRIKFGGFADHVRQLSRVAPKEFEIFFTELKNKVAEVSKYKAPSGHKYLPCTKKFYAPPTLNPQNND